MKKIGLVLASLTMFGLAGASSASTCALDDVTLGGFSADSCGTADGDKVANTPDGYPMWDVNINSDGGRSDWQFYYKQDLGNQSFPNGTITPDFNLGGEGIDLQITSTGGNDAWDTGTFTVNAQNPLLIVLGNGGNTDYAWYLFTGYSGTQSGTWDTTNLYPAPGMGGGGKDLSNIAAYTVVPVPAAVWLFGSGLLGLVGVARRKRA